MLFQASFEDYIYILVGIVWIAYSIYKGTQKSKSKQNKQNETEPVEKKKSVFETFLDKIIVEEKPLPYDVAENEEVIFDDVEIADKPDKVFSYDDYYEESNFQSDSNVFENKVETETKIKQEIGKSPSVKRKNPRIDLRKAVVYSEILNRRYF